jgi:hypothetical protein
MDWSGLGKAIAGYAPLLGGVVGGPAGAGIGSIIASVFGVEDNPESILKAIEKDPQAAIKLKKIELDHKVELEKLALETSRIELADKQNARKENKHSNMPAILSCVLSLVIVGIIYMLFYTIVPEGSKDVLFMLLGVVVKEWGGAMQYWFGTTRSSANKDMKK